MAVVCGCGIKGELCLDEKCSTARVRSLSNSSSSSQMVSPLNTHWSCRLDDSGAAVAANNDDSDSSEITDSALSPGRQLLLLHSSSADR